MRGYMKNVVDLLAESRLMKMGASAAYLEGFASALANVGHTQLTIWDFLVSASHFGRWLEAKGTDLVEINEHTVIAFGRHRCCCFGGHRKGHGVSRYYTARVQRFIEYLRFEGVIKARENTTPDVPTPLVNFRHWLLRHR